MIHVATVHWHSELWIDIQLAYLRRYLDRPYLVYADLEGVDPRHADRFEATTSVVVDSPNGSERHAGKLNALAALIARHAAPDDTLVFLDGDAFPVAPLGDFLEDCLSRWPLAAIRRDENLGDRQPHPSFCATTVGFWDRLEGDWSPGEDWAWRNAVGWSVSDPGGKLLHQLERRGIDWRPLLRTSPTRLHPLFFGVYEHRIYHHGAGFRRPFCRVDRRVAGPIPEVPPALMERPAARSPVRLLVWKIRAKAWYLTRKRGVQKRQNRITRRNAELSERVFSTILADEQFHRRLGSAPARGS
jgi:hypothetical protein